MTCLDAKASFGSSPSPQTNGHQSWRKESLTAEVKENSEREDSNTGRYSFTSTENSPSPVSRKSFLKKLTLSSRGAKPPRITCGKTLRRSKEQDSSWGRNPFVETVRPTGMLSGMQQGMGTSWQSPLPSEFNVIATLDESEAISQHLLRWSVPFTFSGELPVAVNQDEHGMKQVSLLTLKAPARSSGMAIKVI